MAKPWRSSFKILFRNLVGRQETAVIEKYLEMGVQITFVEFLGPKDLMEATEGMQENQVMSCYVPERGSGDS